MRLVFFNSSTGIGGAEILNIRLALHCMEYGYETLMILPKDSYTSSKVEGIVPRCFIEDGLITLKKGDVLIAPLSYADDLGRWFEKSKARVLFWSIHSKNFFLRPRILGRLCKYSDLLCKYMAKLLLSKKYSRRRSFLQLISDNNSVCFMDSGNNNSLNQFYNLNIPDTFLPIPITLNKFDKGSVNKGKISLAWVGRIDESYKYNSLSRILTDLRVLNKDKKISMHVIGDGPGLKKIKSKFNDSFIKYHGVIDSENLNYFIIKNVDIGLSMGTAALEFAKCSIPVIALDTSYLGMRNYKYEWLHNKPRYNLGVMVHGWLYSGNNKLNLSEVIGQYCADPIGLSEKSYKHVKLNHDIKRVFPKLINLSKNAKMHLDKVIR